MRRCWLIMVMVFTLSMPAVAQQVQDLRDQADAFWARRDVLENALKAIELYEQVADKDPNDLEARILIARGAYWVAENEPAEIKPKDMVNLLVRGINAAKQVLAKDEENPAARYWLMRDCAAKNTLESIFDFDLSLAIVGTIFVAKGDVNYHFGGIYRYWGEVIYAIPGLLGKFFHFTVDDEIWLFKRAIEIEPGFLANKYMLARSYVKKKDLVNAKRTLEEIVSASPDALPGWEPENRFYQKLAQEMLTQL